MSSDILGELQRWLEMVLQVLRGPSGWQALEPLLAYTGHVTETPPARL